MSHKFAAIALMASTGCSANTATVESVRQELTAKLPIGSSAEQVIAYLNTAGFDFDGGKYTIADLSDNADSAHMGADPATLQMNAIIRDVRYFFPVSYSISVKFTFDHAKKLRRTDVEEVGTGP